MPKAIKYFWFAKCLKCEFQKQFMYRSAADTFAAHHQQLSKCGGQMIVWKDTPDAPMANKLDHWCDKHHCVYIGVCVLCDTDIVPAYPCSCPFPCKQHALYASSSSPKKLKAFKKCNTCGEFVTGVDECGCLAKLATTTVVPAPTAPSEITWSEAVVKKGNWYSPYQASPPHEQDDAWHHPAHDPNSVSDPDVWPRFIKFGRLVFAKILFYPDGQLHSNAPKKWYWAVVYGFQDHLQYDLVLCAFAPNHSPSENNLVSMLVTLNASLSS